MFIAKWNKSVILTYIGMFFSITGMLICLTTGNIKHALSCLVVSGICDMFDGYVARKCKRTKEEINFGIQLDSLVDTLSFVAFPIIIMLKMGLTKWYHLIPLTMFGIGGIARLAHFNITTNDVIITPIVDNIAPNIPETFNPIKVEILIAKGPGELSLTAMKLIISVSVSQA